MFIYTYTYVYIYLSIIETNISKLHIYIYRYYAFYVSVCINTVYMIIPDGRKWSQGFTVLAFGIFPVACIHLDIISQHQVCTKSKPTAFLSIQKWNGHPDVWIVETWIDHGFDSAQK